MEKHIKKTNSKHTVLIVAISVIVAVVVLTIISNLNKSMAVTGQAARSSQCSAGWKCYNSTTKAYQDKQCRWDRFAKCAYGCSNGQCNPAPRCTPAWVCLNSSYRAYQVSNCSYISQSYCTYGCLNGSCLSAPPARCGDSSCNGNETCVTCSADCGVCPPTCTAGWICIDNSTKVYQATNCSTSSRTNCPNGCQNGTCLSAPQTSCGDAVCNGPETCLTCQTDCGVCPPTCQVGWACVNNYTLAYRYVNCSIVSPSYCQYGCSNVQCNQYPPPSQNQTCTDSDHPDGDANLSFGEGTHLKGTTCQDSSCSTDYCYSSDSLKEYYCENQVKKVSIPYFCPLGCQDGACLPPLTGPCTDTENGQDPYVKGTTCMTGGACYEDQCVPAASGDRFYVHDYYCRPERENTPDKIIFMCPNTCSDGACSYSPDPCTDDDAWVRQNPLGREVDVRGTVHQGTMIYTDYCINATKVREYSCGDSVFRNQLTWSDSECMYTTCNGGQCGLLTPEQMQNVVSCGGTEMKLWVKETLVAGPYTFTDYCKDNTTVMQYRCTWNNNVAYLDLVCFYGCVDGACL